MTSATDTSIEPSSRVVRGEAIDFAEVGDTLVMMDLDEGRYYELNPMGARVWALIESGPRVAELCEALIAEYEIAPETCRRETRAFLEELSRLAVVRIRPSADGVEWNGGSSHDTNDGAMTTARKLERGSRTTRTAKLSGTTPTIRIMPIKRTEAGTYVYGDFETGQDNYIPES